jgi:hypothetical protein
VADSVDIALFESAIQAQVVAGTGLADGQVVLRDQNARAPAGTYLTVATDGPITVGGPKSVYQSYDATKPLGQEVGLTVQGPAEMRVSVQGYTGATVGDANAQALLQQLRMYLQLPTTRDLLHLAGISVIDFGQVRRIPAVFGSAMEGRAILELRCYVNESATARTGYISQVGGAVPNADGSWTPPSGGPVGAIS